MLRPRRVGIPHEMMPLYYLFVRRLLER